VESAKAQDLSDLERKVERYICEAGVNVVIGLIISQGKRRYESDFEEGSCVLKIWTVIDDKDRDREVQLAENTVRISIVPFEQRLGNLSDYCCLEAAESR